MKKLMAFLCSVLAVLFMNMALQGTVEAARVAVIPIDVDVKVERAGDFNSYYWDMLIDRFRYPDYELLECVLQMYRKYLSLSCVSLWWNAL